MSVETERVVVVGGGFAGLATAAKLATEHIPVTLLEGSQLGNEASTQNQGWLYSGAWYARRDLEMARLCYESLQQTIRFCPECLEPGHTGMLYFSCQSADEMAPWVEAWKKAGIPHEPLSAESAAEKLPGFNPNKVFAPYLLPDRSIRTDVLIGRLAEVAMDAGVNIRTGARVREFVREDDAVTGVLLCDGERIDASLVVIATGASGSELWGQVSDRKPGGQQIHERVALLGHLVATTPGIGAWPFCAVDADGFNHMPHLSIDQRTSVFGTGSWSCVPPTERVKASQGEFDRIQAHIDSFVPAAKLVAEETCCWFGVTVQAMHIDQVYPGRVPYPTVLDHSIEPPNLRNVISVYPGRATLWSNLAEQVANYVSDRFDHKRSEAIASPPWA
ncbi:MAG: NAD(P)/FAD-dependent oxidoreductase [Planctomycetaceae bacterium]